MTNNLENSTDPKVKTGQHNENERKIPHVNGHIHTPYSFSAFTNVEQAFQLADAENIKVLGINDFNTFDGYREFTEMGLNYNMYPLLNIEFMGLIAEFQRKGIRVNDPANPGRIYFSGKGMDFPVNLTGKNESKFNAVKQESLLQAKEMLEKASAYLKIFDPSLSLDYHEIMEKYTRGMLRERHIAKAIREKIYTKYSSGSDRESFLQTIFQKKEVKSSIDNLAGIENEIRSNLLKAGGPAFVKENTEAFLPLEEILEIIRSGGGIPCYPVLLDDNKGNFTEFESDKEQLLKNLQANNIFCIELIPNRNDFDIFKEFVQFFHAHGFIILFGTEHNTPELTPLTVSARGNRSLDDNLKKINYEGACIIAAHQYLRARGEQSLNSADFSFTNTVKNDFIKLGETVISNYCSTKN